MAYKTVKYYITIFVVEFAETVKQGHGNLTYFLICVNEHFVPKISFIIMK